MNEYRLLGVQIPKGFSSEARVFAGLLAERAPDIRARVLMHRSADEVDAFARFGEMARAEMVPYDSGWRPSRTGLRRTPDRLPIAARFVWRRRQARDRAADFLPDVVYSGQQHYECRTATTVAADLGIPQIIHLHFTIGRLLQTPVIERLLTCEHVITVSDFVRDLALDHGVAESRVTTIRNTMRPFPDADPDLVRSVRRELAIPDSAAVLGMVGRLEDGKGHLDAIQAFERLAAERDDVWLVIAGTGHDRKQILKAAAASPATSRIVFTGQRPDIPVLLRTFDVFVHPATDDPCPLAVLEAMATARATIAYDQGGPAEMLRNGISGLLTPHRSIDGLHEAMRHLVDDADERSLLGAGALQALKRDFRPEDAGRRFSETIRQVASSGTASA